MIFVETPTASSCVARTDFVLHYSESTNGNVAVTANDDYRPRAHVLLLTYDRIDTFFSGVAKSFRRTSRKSVVPSFPRVTSWGAGISATCPPQLGIGQADSGRGMLSDTR